MEGDKARRISTPIISNTKMEEPFKNFRTSRAHRSFNHVTKQPEISVILEVDTDSEMNEERSARSSQVNQSGAGSRPASISSSKFDVSVPPERSASTRDSRRSTRSVRSTISTKSLKLTKAARYGSAGSVANAQSESGNVKNAFQLSSVRLNRSTSSLQSTATAPVVREQYFCCRKWSKREKILTTVVVTLVFLVCGLVIAIGVVAKRRAERNLEESAIKF